MANVRLDWRHLETFSFGDTPELAEELAQLVLQGRKRATCWSVADGMQTEVGKHMVMLDGKGRPRAVVQTTELTTHRYLEVDAAFAHDEGEGDLSLDYWQQAHRQYFTRKQQFAVDMLLWCERFRVIQILDETATG